MYEIGFAVSGNSGQCSQASPPLPYINITNRKIEVNGILKATCYAFGVRRYLLLNTCKYAVLFVFKADIVIKWYTDLCNNTKRN